MSSNDERQFPGDNWSERFRFVEFRLDQIEKRQESYEEIFVRLDRFLAHQERYKIVERAVIALFAGAVTAMAGWAWRILTTVEIARITSGGG